MLCCVAIFVIGGESVDSRWVRKVLKKGAPQQLLHVYGPTEGTTFSSWYEVQDVSEEATSIPIGCPITNTQIYLLDEQLQPVPIGIPGELYISGDGLARGYLNRPELTSQRFITNPFVGAPFMGAQLMGSQPGTRLYKTGDLARYRADGNIEFLGRIDNQVKIRGFRIELGEIESVLNQHPAVREAVVIVQQDVPDDKHLVAYIVFNEQVNNPKTSELRQFLNEKLPQYMVPSAYVTLDTLPLTPNGKVNRHLLPEVDAFNLDTEQSYVAPGTCIEEELARIWCQILGKQQVGIYDNFFELGGHSLLATQLTSRIRDAFQVELSVRILFEAPTVASLAKHIETICWAAQGQDTANSTGNEREDVEF
jgi:acyl-CoA synthetase (AMP-forming)/AMP-acid ligase II/acyl carrier protein